MPAKCPRCGAVLISGQPLCTECGEPTGEAAAAGGRTRAQGPAPAGPRRDKQKDFSLVGKVVADKYKVLEVLGQGGFGTVYLVEILAGMVGEKLAMKVLPEELSRQGSFREQFLNEIRVAMRLVDRYIVQIRDVGVTGEGTLYYTMDYCPGTTLAQILRQEGKLPITRALIVVLNVLRALQTAHAAGIVHRDLKPANIMVETQAGKDSVRVLDFGIATAIQSGEKQKGFAGSPHYMPPEQFIGDRIDFYTDLYSVGVILYECVTGQRPYAGASAQEVFRNLKVQTPPLPETLAKETAQFPGLSGLVMKTIEKNPERRFQSARELFDAVNAILVRGAGLSSAARETADAPPPPAAEARPQPAPPVPRISPGVVRRRRMARRSPASNAAAVALATFIVAAIVVGVIFHRELGVWVQNTFGGPGGAARPEPRPSKALAPEKAPPVKQEPALAAPKASKDAPRDPRAGGEDAPVSLEEKKAAARAELESRLAKLLEEAREAAGAGDWARVLERAQTAASLDGAGGEAQKLLGLAALRLGDAPKAAAELEKARAALTQPDAEVLAALAEAKLALSPPAMADAEAHAREAVKLAPKDAGAVLVLARVLEAAGKRDELRKVLEAARRGKVESPDLSKLAARVLEGDAKERRTKALELAREAERALEAGDEGAAADLAGKALAAEPVLEAFLVLAESRLAAGEPEGAAKALEHLLELAPGGAEAPAAAKDKLEGLRELAAGLASLEQGAGGGGEKPLAAAETALSAAAKRPDPRLATRARLGLLRLHALKGDVQKALEAAQPLEKDARSWVLLDETRAYLDLGRRAAAKDAKAKAYGAARRRGQALARLKGVPDAHRREGNYLLGAAQVELGDLEKSDAAYREALKCFAAAEEAGLKTAELYESWAAAYDRLGNLIRAASLYRSAYEIRPSPERCLRAAELYLNANPSSPEALEILRRGADLYADSVEIRKKLEELSR